MQKVIIATAFMQLVEQGKVGLDDPIQKYLPHFPNGHAIKIKNFLGHTTGLNERKKRVWRYYAVSNYKKH
ncbi:serine hydrolase [Listeria fleischmannii]|uniref:Penicillin-binding protein n=1 Tax=Listeria fleischmannii FSL S10-1203 TaxID=1265822 RepID=W7DD30_9LIST|nr:penicillin-binding protein [Listeria fleischmannii FSL S10-1203]